MLVSGLKRNIGLRQLIEVNPVLANILDFMAAKMYPLIIIFYR